MERNTNSQLHPIVIAMWQALYAWCVTQEAL